MSDWLDDFQMMGIPLSEGEKSLIRFAMKKERDRILELMRNQICDCYEMTGAEMEERFGKKDLLRHTNHDFQADTIRLLIRLIKGEKK